MCYLFYLMVMDFRLQLQAKFEGRLIISALPPPPWVGGGWSSPSNSRNRCWLFLARGVTQLSLPCTRFMSWAGKVIAKPFSCARRASHSWSPLRDGGLRKSQNRARERTSSCYRKEITILEVTFWLPLKWLGCQLESNSCSPKYSWY